MRYGNPDGSTEPAGAWVDVERGPSGRVSFVVVPRYESMGPLALVDLLE